MKMTKIECIDYLMQMVTKVHEDVLDLYDYLKEKKFLALLEKAAMLRKEISLLREAEMACQKKQEELQEQVDALEKEMGTFKK